MRLWDPYSLCAMGGGEVCLWQCRFVSSFMGAQTIFSYGFKGHYVGDGMLIGLLFVHNVVGRGDGSM